VFADLVVIFHKALAGLGDVLVLASPEEVTACKAAEALAPLGPLQC